MEKSSVKFENPIISWFLWFIVLSVLFYYILSKHFSSALSKDQSGITYLIFVIFIIGVLCSAYQAFILWRHWYFLNDSGKQHLNIPTIIQAILNNYNSDNSYSIDYSIDYYQIKMDVLRKNLNLLSSVMVTVGLIGTILGLIQSMSGLNKIINTIMTSNENLLSGLRDTIGGMGTAFYTTLFGALLGGVILKILSSNLATSLEMVSVSLSKYIRSHLSNKDTQKSSNNEFIVELHKSMDEFNLNLKKTGTLTVKLVSALENNFHQLSNTIQVTDKELNALSQTAINSRLVEVTHTLGYISESLNKITNNK